MRCQACGGYVIWVGPLTNLSHTECLNCNAVNNQEPEDEEDSSEAANVMVV